MANMSNGNNNLTADSLHTVWMSLFAGKRTSKETQLGPYNNIDNLDDGPTGSNPVGRSMAQNQQSQTMD